jgi:hypothetical protein
VSTKKAATNKIPQQNRVWRKTNCVGTEDVTKTTASLATATHWNALEAGLFPRGHRVAATSTTCFLCSVDPTTVTHE